MLELIKKNKNYFENLINQNLLVKNNINIIEELEKEKLLVITWLKWIWKINKISHIIKYSKYNNDYLYITKKFDFKNQINSEKSLNKLLNIFILKYKTPKLIILDNLTSLNKFNDFINFLYKQDYIIIIKSNIINISSKPKIELFEDKKYEFNSINDEEKTFQHLKTQNIIFEEIIKNYSLKNFDLYNYTITFLANNNKISSIREINRNLNNTIKISLVTMMEYIKYSLKANIIKQIYTYDFKKDKTIETKTKYYFTDINLKNSLYNYELPEIILKENFLFNELYKSWYKVNSWINWSYDFSFYGIQTLTKPLSWILSPSQEKEITKININTVFIDFCNSTDKKEIKKQIKKLLKVPEKPIILKNNTNWFTQTFSKYLILDNPKEIWIQKTQYENLKIISLNELLKLI